MININEIVGGPTAIDLSGFDASTGDGGLVDLNSIQSPLDFKKTVIGYMNSRASEYGYPDIFSAMSLVNSSVPELAAEGASWTEFFDSGMTYSDHKIKTNEYKNYSIFISSIEQDADSPKLSFTPSLTYPSVAV